MDAKPTLSIFDIYNIPDKWLAAGASKANRLAILAPDGGKLWEDLRFYVARCCNRGWDVKAFFCKQRAIDWLTSHRSFREQDADDH